MVTCGGPPSGQRRPQECRSPSESSHPVPTPALPAPSDDDLAVAVALAAGAGEVLVGLRAEQGDALPGKELKDAGDAAAQAWLAQALAVARPGDAVLSEEAADDAARLEADRVWIIDPLDGTREFSERLGDGWRDDWAVHIALWQRGRGLTDAASPRCSTARARFVWRSAAAARRAWSTSWPRRPGSRSCRWARPG